MSNNSFMVLVWGPPFQSIMSKRIKKFAGTVVLINQKGRYKCDSRARDVLARKHSPKNRPKNLW